MRGAADQEKGGDGAAKGPSFGTARTRNPPANAHAAAMPSTSRHASGGAAQRTRWGTAEPSVSAPTRIPIAQPRPSRNHPAAIFIPGGYTPASAAPVRSRQAIPILIPRENATPSVASAASAADPATNRRADKRSASVKIALTSAPATNPSWTEIVSQAVVTGESCQRRASVGATADALNQGAIASSSAMATTARTRRGFTARWDDPETPRADRTSSRPAQPAP